MMYWSAWTSGAALAGVMLLHAALTGKMMGVSGRITALVNRARDRSQGTLPAMTQAELAAALAAVSAEEFATSSREPAPSVMRAEMTLEAAPSTTLHSSFLVALAMGGFVAALLHGTLSPTFLANASKAPFLGENVSLSSLCLFTGGILVGFGTRMAGGCTSGHGLSGVSRAQPGSLLATFAFFGAGILASFGLELL